MIFLIIFCSPEAQVLCSSAPWRNGWLFSSGRVCSVAEPEAGILVSSFSKPASASAVWCSSFAGNCFFVSSGWVCAVAEPRHVMGSREEFRDTSMAIRTSSLYLQSSSSDRVIEGEGGGGGCSVTYSCSGRFVFCSSGLLRGDPKLEMDYCADSGGAACDEIHCIP